MRRCDLRIVIVHAGVRRRPFAPHGRSMCAFPHIGNCRREHNCSDAAQELTARAKRVPFIFEKGEQATLGRRPSAQTRLDRSRCPATGCGRGRGDRARNAERPALNCRNWVKATSLNPLLPIFFLQYQWAVLPCRVHAAFRQDVTLDRRSTPDARIRLDERVPYFPQYSESSLPPIPPPVSRPGCGCRWH